MTDILEKNEILNDSLRRILSCIESNEESNYVQTIELFDKLMDTFGDEVTQEANIISIESDYVGLHLGNYEKNDFFKLVASFSNYQVLHAFYTLRILNDALEILNKQSNIREFSLNNENDNTIIVGDLHGNFRDLKHIIDIYGLPGDKYQFVFNGDFVDRGKQQIEVLITVLYAFILNPNRVFLNRGNHENKSCNTNSNFDPNFLTDIYHKYNKYHGIIFDTAEKLFSYLPLATIVTNSVHLRLFICHGGISYNTDLDFIQNKLERYLFKRVSTGARLHLTGSTALSADIVTDILWSDPITYINNNLRPKYATSLNGCYHNTARKVGVYFGEDLLNSFCDKYNITWLIRSHEVRDNGFSKDQEKCFTIFSASRYCGGTNHGAVISLQFDSNEFKVYKYITQYESADEIYLKNIDLIEQFKRILTHNESHLMKIFEQHDPQHSGLLSIDTWAKCICQAFDEIEPSDVIEIRDHLCECDNQNNQVRYLTMFTTSLKNENFMIQLKNLFDIIDRNHSGKISRTEAKNALEAMSKKFDTDLQKRYLNLLMNMDKNSDNQIDFNELKQALVIET